jgi:transcriptional regulator with XRE-family HTH domain
MSMRQLGAKLGWSESKVSRIELAQHTIGEEDLDRVLTALQVDESIREKLLKLAREIHHPAWWESGLDLSPDVATLIETEQRATAITHYCSTVVPALLRTPRYTRALAAAVTPEPEQVQRIAELCQYRQGVFAKEDPVQLEVFLDEAVLARPVGGRAVMAEQLHHLLQAFEANNIELRVVPFSAGEHAGLHGSFMLVEFPCESPVVHLEQHKISTLRCPQEIATFTDAIARLRRAAAPKPRSKQLLTHFLARYRD